MATYTIKLKDNLSLKSCSYIEAKIGSSKCSSCQYHKFISDDTDGHGRRTEFTFKCNFLQKQKENIIKEFNSFIKSHTIEQIEEEIRSLMSQSYNLADYSSNKFSEENKKSKELFNKAKLLAKTAKLNFSNFY